MPKKNRKQIRPKESSKLPVLNPKQESLVRRDTQAQDLQLYLEAIRKYPLLTPQREKELTKEYFKTRSPEIAQILAVSNLRLVVKIAFGYMQSGFSLLDLIQEGNIGLLQGIKEYNPEKGAKLSSYSSYWIKAYIRNFILKNWSLVKMGTTRAQRKLFYRLNKEKSNLEAMGIIPKTRQLAEKLEVKEHEIVEMNQRMQGRDVSVETPLGSSGEGSTLLQTLSTEAPWLDEELADKEIREEFHERLTTFERNLSGKELVIFRERLTSDEPKTLQEIGDKYGITRERVRQIEARVMKKMKEFMKANAKFKERVIDV